MVVLVSMSALFDSLITRASVPSPCEIWEANELPQQLKGAATMNKAIFKKAGLSSILCVAMMSFLLHLAVTCYGEEGLGFCPIPMDVEVSPYQVNIDSRGADHDVRILTYTNYSNTETVFVYFNESLDAIDSEYIQLTRDSLGHLVVRVDLEAIQDAELEVNTYHDVKIIVVLKGAIDECFEKEGIGEIYIVGKKGHHRR
jgi:hypothetical protein